MYCSMSKGEETTPIDWSIRQTICLYCGRTFPYKWGKISEHMYRVHKRKIARSGSDYLIYTRVGNRYTFYVKVENGKKKKTVTVDDPVYGSRVAHALDMLEGGCENCIEYRSGRCSPILSKPVLERCDRFRRRI